MGDPKLLSEADREFIHGIAIRTKAANEQEAEELSRRLERARVEAKALALKVSADPMVKRIVLFGSASTGRRFHLDSDIDLAVEGGDILSHRALVEMSTFRVDVVDLLALPLPILASIESEWEILYAKG